MYILKKVVLQEQNADYRLIDYVTIYPYILQQQSAPIHIVDPTPKQQELPPNMHFGL